MSDHVLCCFYGVFIAVLKMKDMYLKYFLVYTSSYCYVCRRQLISATNPVKL